MGYLNPEGSLVIRILFFVIGLILAVPVTLSVLFLRAKDPARSLALYETDLFSVAMAGVFLFLGIIMILYSVQQTKRGL